MRKGEIMKFKFNLFCKAFLLSFIAFGLIAAIIIANLYLDANAVNPKVAESNVLIGITDNNNLLSLVIVNFAPETKSIAFLPIPDNVWIKNGIILQDLYDKHNISSLKSSLEDISGARINRYLLFSVDSLAELINEMGTFTLNAQYPFEHKGSIKAGSLQLDGELTKAMFLYDGYDMTNVSFSNIGFSYLNTFLATFAKPTHIQALTNILTSKSFLRKIHTDISKNEMNDYCELLSLYNSFSQRTIEINGTYNRTSSSTYFIPHNQQTDKNIFK